MGDWRPCVEDVIITSSKSPGSGRAMQRRKPRSSVDLEEGLQGFSFGDPGNQSRTTCPYGSMQGSLVANTENWQGETTSRLYSHRVSQKNRQPGAVHIYGQEAPAQRQLSGAFRPKMENEASVKSAASPRTHMRTGSKRAVSPARSSTEWLRTNGDTDQDGQNNLGVPFGRLQRTGYFASDEPQVACLPSPAESYDFNESSISGDWNAGFCLSPQDAVSFDEATNYGSPTRLLDAYGRELASQCQAKISRSDQEMAHAATWARKRAAQQRPSAARSSVGAAVTSADPHENFSTPPPESIQEHRPANHGKNGEKKTPAVFGYKPQRVAKPKGAVGSNNPGYNDNAEKTSTKRRKTKKVQRGHLFACPFAKHDPGRYETVFTSCTLPPGLEPKRVTEHIRRLHSAKTKGGCLWCTTRWIDSENWHDEFIRHECPVRADRDANPECMTFEQEEAMNTLNTANLPTSESRWKEIYSRLFPDSTPVPSPLYDYYTIKHRIDTTSPLAPGIDDPQRVPIRQSLNPASDDPWPPFTWFPGLSEGQWPPQSYGY